MMQMAAYGRLGQDPRSIETSTGKAMAVASLAVTLTDRQGEEHTQWLGLVAFGKVAELLLKHSKGELVSASGRVQMNTYSGRDGQRSELQVICDSVVSARTVRPGGGKRKGADSTSSREKPPADAPFDDEIAL